MELLLAFGFAEPKSSWKEYVSAIMQAGDASLGYNEINELLTVIEDSIKCLTSLCQATWSKDGARGLRARPSG